MQTTNWWKLKTLTIMLYTTKKSQSKNNRHFPTEVEILSGCEITQSRLGIVEEITQVQKPNCKK